MKSKGVEKGRREIWPQMWNERSLSGERGAVGVPVVRGDIVRVPGMVPGRVCPSARMQHVEGPTIP